MLYDPSGNYINIYDDNSNQKSLLFYPTTPEEADKYLETYTTQEMKQFILERPDFFKNLVLDNPRGKSSLFEYPHKVMTPDEVRYEKMTLGCPSEYIPDIYKFKLTRASCLFLYSINELARPKRKPSILLYANLMAANRWCNFHPEAISIFTHPLTDETCVYYEKDIMANGGHRIEAFLSLEKVPEKPIWTFVNRYRFVDEDLLIEYRDSIDRNEERNLQDSFWERNWKLEKPEVSAVSALFRGPWQDRTFGSNPEIMIPFYENNKEKFDALFRVLHPVLKSNLSVYVNDLKRKTQFDIVAPAAGAIGRMYFLGKCSLRDIEHFVNCMKEGMLHPNISTPDVTTARRIFTWLKTVKYLPSGDANNNGKKGAMKYIMMEYAFTAFCKNKEWKATKKMVEDISFYVTRMEKLDWFTKLPEADNIIFDKRKKKK